MSDPYRRDPADELDEQTGETTEPTGKPYDGREKRHGNVSQSPTEALDDQPDASDNADEAERMTENRERPG